MPARVCVWTRAGGSSACERRRVAALRAEICPKTGGMHKTSKSDHLRRARLGIVGACRACPPLLVTFSICFLLSSRVRLSDHLRNALHARTHVRGHEGRSQRAHNHSHADLSAFLI